MHHFLLRAFSVAVLCSLICGCSSYQPTKNVWKGTKNLWYTYVSPPASVNYDDKGELSPRALALTNSMMGIDIELGKLERVMLNADKPPTREWMSSFFSTFPWIGGFAGVKYDGTILGREPANSMKPIDFVPLLYEDAKQNSRALRGDVQSTALGPEVLLATPLYDGVDFLGIVAAHFDFRSLMQFSQSPQNMVVLSPYALLWPGEYDFASTPLAGLDWNEIATKSSSGTCSNAHGSFYYMVRYLGNLPLIFAVAENDNFPKGDGSLEQGLSFFPKERPKLDPPARPEREKTSDSQALPSFDSNQNDLTKNQATPVVHDSATEIQPGSERSVLMQQKRSQRRANVQERQLDGENVKIERVQPSRKRSAPTKQTPEENTRSAKLLPESGDAPTLPGGRPSPFGPREESRPEFKKPSPFGPSDDSQRGGTVNTQDAVQQDSQSVAPKAKDIISQEKAPATLPGGRPSPFGPK